MKIPNALKLLPEKIIQLSFLQRFGLAFLCGLLSVLALPPFEQIYVGFISFPIFVLVLDGAKSHKGAFWCGWAFGFGYFLAGLYWISNALLIDSEKFLWLVPFAASGLPAFLAFFIAAPALLYKILAEKNHPARIVMLVTLLVLFEGLRGILFTGFPWNLFGYMITSSLVLSQSAAAIGIYGLSFCALLLYFIPVWWIQKQPRWCWGVFFIAGIMFIFGAIRLHTPLPSAESIEVRLIQANIPQEEKYAGINKRDHIRKHIDLSLLPREKPYDLLIWPETAVSYALNQEPMLRKSLGSLLYKESYLITGALSIEQSEEMDSFRLYNGIFVLDSKGEIKDFYAKSKLVPFGEYVPFRNTLGLQRITGEGIDFSQGEGLRTLFAGKISFSPLVCYEAIFPGKVVNQRHVPPRLIINLTNDAWYGNSAGPYQHLAIARVRAIEEGRVLIRVANSGFTAIYNPLGQEIFKSTLFQEQVVDQSVILSELKPPYSLLGNLWLFIFMGVICSLAFIYQRV